MISVIKSFLKRFSFQEPQVVLGRWGLDYCTVALHRKVTMTNEDHCGTCGSTILKEQVRKEKDELEWIQYMV